ncbi:hypothetical protein [Actinomadura madurae]|uniref:hypothetical protein n=1 Tax=Actinomadura madurae TaxID=1993 RepID=UPI0020D226DA|nr:hypothetical protein [Actinomadura madurae]MCP9977745.1 hypothetical protein [Actinomadura madurae]
MIEVTGQINAVRRKVGERVLEARHRADVDGQPGLRHRRRGPVGRRHQPRADPPLVPADLG